jgi:hypothetical protein
MNAKYPRIFQNKSSPNLYKPRTVLKPIKQTFTKLEYHKQECPIVISYEFPSEYKYVHKITIKQI